MKPKTNNNQKSLQTKLLICEDKVVNLQKQARSQISMGKCMLEIATTLGITLAELREEVNASKRVFEKDVEA